MRRAVLVAITAVLVFSPAVLAEEPPQKTDTPEQAAEKVLAAAEAGDRDALETLAARNVPDPWIVAEELCQRGRYAAATAYAEAAPRLAVEKLPGYVAAHRDRPPDEKTRQIQAAVAEAKGEGRLERVLAASATLERPLDSVSRVRIAMARGIALQRLRRIEVSARELRAAGEAAVKLGWLSCANDAFHMAGLSAWRHADYGAASGAWERALEVSDALGNELDVATALGNLGLVRGAMGDYPSALAYQERALALKVKQGYPDRISRTLCNIAFIHRALCDYPKALEYCRRARTAAEAVGPSAALARALLGIGMAHRDLGDFPKAQSTLEQALQMSEDIDDPLGIASALGNLGVVHKSLRDYRQANACQERALAIFEAQRDRANVALTLGNIATLLGLMDEHEKSLAVFERAHALHEQTNNRPGMALTLANIGAAYAGMGRHEEALDFYERALEVQESLNDRAHASKTLGNIGRVYSATGDVARALAYRKKAFALADEIGAVETVLHQLMWLARLHLELGHRAEAIEAAKSAVDALGQIARGLAEEQAAETREEHLNVFEVGLYASFELQDAAEAFFFMESGRAGSLLVFLGGRERLHAFLVPGPLKSELAKARAEESMAAHRLTRSYAGGIRREIRARRTDLDSAREGVRKIIQRVQMKAKAAADVLYPQAAPLQEITGRIGTDEALVLYSLTSSHAMALVVTSDGGRLVALGPAEPIREAVSAFRPQDPEVEPGTSLAAVRQKLLTPLDLPEGTKRLLVSPEGVLCNVPFAALFPGEVLYVPSGTTYALLQDEERARGEGILALGDPDYTGTTVPTAAPAHRRGGRLLPLPATRKEVNALGTDILLGKDATEAGLVKALEKRPRWRAVHLACHGIIDPQRATFSSLAVTPDEENDGFLTCLEVMRSRIPADLVVLSACDTARGKVYRAEGIMGLARAFMMAGAPRVLCSLWPVDDQATQALMVKFYELWNPDEGEGLPAAAALRGAQMFVRSHEAWRHPYYWAAWVLWGLSD